MSTARRIVSDCILVVDLAEISESAFAVDPHLRIVYWSPASEGLLGFSADEVMGSRCCEVLRAEGGGSCGCGQFLRPSAESGEVRLVNQFKTQVTTHDGHPKQLCITVVRTHSIEGDVRIMHFLRELPALPESEPAPCQGENGRAHGELELPAPHLTDRELEVLRLLASGLGTGEIATALSISPITARNHITRVIEKLEVKTRLQAVITASRSGLI